MSLENFVDVALVLSIVFIVQMVKKTLGEYGITKSKSFWLIIVMLIGIPMCLIAEVSTGFETWRPIWIGSSSLIIKILQQLFVFIKSSFVYSAAASLVYQTGKLQIPWLNNSNSDTTSGVS